ncbi:hypothetical protein [Micromonospora siamensis]|uniref:Uncharacterized protein n=1 Tax=Micromonospora siamensis TaxID=299152 RepID=A0A1C5HJJ7_9ACTN|nr:hypothetical protein [Micromonospora siamensis]SCG46148.1 hypothetical protein GA0074704_1843 [Micromonospora siamensis]
MQVIHHPRVAWDTARALVAAAGDDDLFRWYSGELGELLGVGSEQALHDTRDRLRRDTTGGRAMVEAGLWRVRLADALTTRPDLADPLRDLTTIATGRLHSRRAGLAA